MKYYSGNIKPGLVDIAPSQGRARARVYIYIYIYKLRNIV
jgi:hypothetical protein